MPEIPLTPYILFYAFQRYNCISLYPPPSHFYPKLYFTVQIHWKLYPSRRLTMEILVTVKILAPVWLTWVCSFYVLMCTRHSVVVQFSISVSSDCACSSRLMALRHTSIIHCQCWPHHQHKGSLHSKIPFVYASMYWSISNLNILSRSE